MVLNIIGTILFFPLYLLIRWPYFNLPMGPDVGYYVSNHTVLNRNLSFCRGWNANYALCSKLLPETFLGFIYAKYGHEKYSVAWRFAFSFFNFITAILVGWCAHIVIGGAPFGYLGGLISYGLLSSEPDYGSYYESAEQFEALFQILGTVLIIAGLMGGNEIVVMVGAAAWFFDAFFVKITGFAVAVPIFAGVIFIEPILWIAITVEFAVFGVLYLLLLLKCGKNPLDIVKNEIGHQSHFSREDLKEGNVSDGIFHQWRRKAKQTKKIFSGNAVIPLIGFVGLISLPEYVRDPGLILLKLFLAGLVLKFLISFLPIWYYMLPLLLALGLLSAVGFVEILKKGIYGVVLLVILGGIWSYLNVFRIIRMDQVELAKYTWKTRPDMGDLHVDLDSIKHDLEEAVGDNSFFVYGIPVPNALIGRSYDVPFLTAAYYLDDMIPGWQKELHSRMLSSHPQYIFDMFQKFDQQALYQNLGLRYDLIKSWDGRYGQYHLYRFEGKISIEKPNLDFRSMKK